MNTLQLPAPTQHRYIARCEATNSFGKRVQVTKGITASDNDEQGRNEAEQLLEFIGYTNITQLILTPAHQS